MLDFMWVDNSDLPIQKEGVQMCVVYRRNEHIELSCGLSCWLEDGCLNHKSHASPGIPSWMSELQSVIVSYGWDMLGFRPVFVIFCVQGSSQRGINRIWMDLGLGSESWEAFLMQNAHGEYLKLEKREN